MTDTYKIIIGGDLLPNKDSIEYFEKGNLLELFDEQICSLFQKSDFSILNLEGALTDSNAKQRKVGPVLKSSKATACTLKKMGLKAVSLANNHFTDYLDSGCDDTIETLEEASIIHVGGWGKASEKNNHIFIQLGETKVCIYSVSETFFNVLDSGAGVNIYDEYIVCNELKALKKSCDYLIVIYHGGAEMFPYPTPQLRQRFHRMSDCGADFITAQHTHCIGCEEQYGNSYLLYGQGNFYLPQMKSPMACQGLVSVLSFFSDKKVSIENKFVTLCNNKLIVDPEQDFSSFKQRSEEIKKDGVILDKYEGFISHNTDLKRKYYLSYRGNDHGRKFFMRFLPGFYLRHIEKKYDRQYLERIVFSLESDRMREEVSCLWKLLLKQKEV